MPNLIPSQGRLGIMKAPILTLPLRTRRHLITARQRARQIAKLLGFGPYDQPFAAVAVFETGQQAIRHLKRCDLHFTMEDRTSRVYPSVRRRPINGVDDVTISRHINSFEEKLDLHLCRPLPADASPPTSEELAWLLEEVGG